LACGDDGGGEGGAGSGGGQVTTGLPREKALSSLSEAEAISACEQLRMSADNAVSEDDLARYTCTIAAALFSITTGANGMPTIDRAMCEQMVNSCLAETDEQGESSSSGMCDASFMTGLMGCNATAGELEACLNASIDVLRDQLSMVSCTSPVSLAGPDAGMSASEPPACASLDMKCPGVLAMIDDEMGIAGGDGEPTGPGGCTDTCSDANDDFCDDGGDGFDPTCDYGTDCADCGPRPMR
jgi:hypothetical protein